MKRILAFVVVLSVLLSVCSISAAAAPVYSVAADTKAVTPFALTALNAAVVPADTGSTLINGDSSYWSTWSSYFAGYLSYAGYSVAESVYRSMNALNSSVASLSSIDLSTDAIRTDVSSILSDMGAITTAIQTVVTAIETNTTAVGGVVTAVEDVNDSLNSFSDLFDSVTHSSSGLSFLNSGGYASTASSRLHFTTLLRLGLLGLQAQLNTPDGSAFLSSSGRNSTIAKSDGITFQYIIRHGFQGIRSLIAGSESDNDYSFTLWDNNNTSTSSSAVGLGPMLNSYLGNVGENLAKLAFMFAADDDIQLKADSQPVLDEVTDTVFGSGSGKVKLDVSNVSDLTGMSDDVLGYFETGGQIGDINTVVNDDSTWLWFTSQTAADLDTTYSSFALADNELESEVDSHTEWYASFYRDVLGRDYVGG